MADSTETQTDKSTSTKEIPKPLTPNDAKKAGGISRSVLSFLSHKVFLLVIQILLTTTVGYLVSTNQKDRAVVLQYLKSERDARWELVSRIEMSMSLVKLHLKKFPDGLSKMPGGVTEGKAFDAFPIIEETYLCLNGHKPHDMETSFLGLVQQFFHAEDVNYTRKKNIRKNYLQIYRGYNSAKFYRLQSKPGKSIATISTNETMVSINQALGNLIEAINPKESD